MAILVEIAVWYYWMTRDLAPLTGALCNPNRRTSTTENPTQPSGLKFAPKVARLSGHPPFGIYQLSVPINVHTANGTESGGRNVFVPGLGTNANSTWGIIEMGYRRLKVVD